MLRRTIRRPSATANFPCEYVPKPIAGRSWAPPTVAAQRKRDESNIVSKLLQRQRQTTAPVAARSGAATAAGTAAFRETEMAVQHFESEVKPSTGFFSVPSIDYSLHDGISPLMSATQASLLLDVHHAGLVKRLNELTLGTIYEGHPLDSVIFSTAFDAENAAVHTCACEHWNHTFAWKSMLPYGSKPSARLVDVMTTSTMRQRSSPVPLQVRGSDGAVERASALAALSGFDKCKRMLSDACRDAAASGGGWVFLVSTQGGQCFEVIRYRPGTSPITSEVMPLVAINMQLHARYADYTDDDSSTSSNSSTGVLGYINNALVSINWQLAERNWLKQLNSDVDS